MDSSSWALFHGLFFSWTLLFMDSFLLLLLQTALQSLLVGAIRHSNKLDVTTWNIPAAGAAAGDESSSPVIFETECTLEDVSELIGRSLTVHETEKATSPTIAMAVCGLANPTSCFSSAKHSSLKCDSTIQKNDGPGSTSIDTPSPSKANGVMGGRQFRLHTVVAGLVVGLLFSVLLL